MGEIRRLFRMIYLFSGKTQFVKKVFEERNSDCRFQGDFGNTVDMILYTVYRHLTGRDFPMIE